MTPSRISCQHCGGEGTKYASKYGGNDPDVWPTGRCEACDGSGDQMCEDCGECVATHEYKDPRNARNKFFICNACFAEWTGEDNA